MQKRALETVQHKKFQTVVQFTKANSLAIFRGATLPTNIFAEHLLVSTKKNFFSFFSDKSYIFVAFSWSKAFFKYNPPKMIPRRNLTKSKRSELWSEVIPDSNKTIDEQYLNLTFLVAKQQFIVVLQITCSEIFLKIHWKTPAMEF